MTISKAYGKVPASLFVSFILFFIFASIPLPGAEMIRFFDLEKAEHAAIIKQNKNASLSRFRKDWLKRMLPVIRTYLMLGEKYKIGIVIDNRYSSRFYFSSSSRASLFAREWKLIAETFKSSSALAG